MDVKHNHEKILIIVALVFCAGILFYNAFFIPDISIPSVIYVDAETNKSEPSESAGEELPKDSTSSDSSESNSSSSSSSANEKVNINTATAEELDEKLTGVGPAIAARIIEYRDSVGGFKSIDEIKNVSGIGEKIFEKIRASICV